jgi:GT2 family glycosyltransferase
VERTSVEPRRISVVIPTYNASASIAACLRSLLANSYRGDFEVIVVDSSNDDTARIVGEQFPDVELYRLPTRAFPGTARNFGVARASGEILAFIDADCIADVDWLEAIARAHDDAPDPAIGGVIANRNPESYVGWASYFCKFSRWIPQAAPRRMVEIPTCCLSVKRWAVESCGPFLDGTLSSDTAFSWRLGRRGHPPLLVPSIEVAHINQHRLGRLLSNLRTHGRDFASVRVAEQRFSKTRRLAFALIAPLLPPLLFARTATDVLRRRGYLVKFLLASPLVLLGHAAWALGELEGYLSSR